MEIGINMQTHLQTLLAEIQNGSAQLFDVREQNEWDAGHLAQATLVPLSQLREFEIDESLNKNIKTYIHCRSGQRVLTAAPILEDMGFSEVIALEEGFADLSDEGFEVA